VSPSRTFDLFHLQLDTVLKILILNQFCTPELNAKSVPFARELRRRGHQVRILTGFPNYPGGKLYPGYRLRLKQHDRIDGIPILRVPLYPSHDRSAFRRTFHYLSFAGSATLPALLGWKPDVIYVWSLVSVGLVATLASWFRRVPFVIDIQDLWPDAVLHSGMAPGWIGRPLTWFCRFIYDQAAAVVVLSPGHKQLLIERGFPNGRVHVIYNWCDEEVFLDSHGAWVGRREPCFEGRFNILFAGMMHPTQGLGVVIEAAARVRQSHPHVQFVFIGSGSDTERLKAKAMSISPENTLFLGKYPPEEAARLLRQADVLLVQLRKDPLFCSTIPSKTQAYLAMGNPILAGLEGDAADLVRRPHAGIVYEPENVEDMVRAVDAMVSLAPEQLREMGLRGQEFYRNELSMRVGVSHFEDVFRSVVNIP
jgi:colanic acid biosynthesis glycosyl transferase WcaI